MEPSNFGKLKHNYFFVALFLLLLVFVSMQLYLLTNEGTKGEELNSIRVEQNQIQVENEMLKAKVMQLRSNQMVLTGLEQRAVVEQKSLTVIDPEKFNIAAQN